MAKKNYKMDSGAWLTHDVDKGAGRGQIEFSAPLWRGREDRLTIRVVRKEETGSMRAITIRQKGVIINDIPVDKLTFPITGGDKQILITTNASALNALITSDKDVHSFIKAFTTASGLNIDVNDIELNYGFAGDPGLEDAFQVSIIVSCPDNSNGAPVDEYITINGKLIHITQEGMFVPYISIDKEFNQIDAKDTHNVLHIDSNLNEYNIEIEECYSEDIRELVVDKSTVELNPDGYPEMFRINTTPEDLGWKIKNV